MDERSISSESTETIAPAKPGPLMRVGRVLVVALAMLSFPSVLPGMVAFWIAVHTVLAKWRRPAWVPLLICLSILVAKLVPRTPAVMMFGLALVVAIGFRYQIARQARAPWWLTPALLWMAWICLVLEWRSIETRVAR